MKKILYTLLSISILIVSLAIAGCGSDGDKYLGTWGDKSGKEYYLYEVIEKGSTSDSYIVTSYFFSNKKLIKEQEIKKDATIKDGSLVTSSGTHYYLKDGKLVTNNGRTIYQKDSEKAMSFDEIINTLKK